MACIGYKQAYKTGLCMHRHIGYRPGATPRHKAHIKQANKIPVGCQQNAYLVIRITTWGAYYNTILLPCRLTYQLVSQSLVGNYILSHLQKQHDDRSIERRMVKQKYKVIHYTGSRRVKPTTNTDTDMFMVAWALSWMFKFNGCTSKKYC